jgi:hypothetical protein
LPKDLANIVYFLRGFLEVSTPQDQSRDGADQYEDYNRGRLSSIHLIYELEGGS